MARLIRKYLILVIQLIQSSEGDVRQGPEVLHVLGLAEVFSEGEHLRLDSFRQKTVSDTLVVDTVKLLGLEMVQSYYIL